MTVDIAVIDYGMGNLRSVSKAIEYVAPECRVVVTNDPAVVEQAERVVFPGQGAMPDCMRELKASGLHAAVLSAAQTKPFLGICIGLKMLFECSEEGDTPGLGLLPGQVQRFPASLMQQADGTRLKVPHMGWNPVKQSREHALWQGIPDMTPFYFVHSYYAVPAQAELTVGQSNYGGLFTCAVAADNIFAVQFHPEKSAEYGLRLYRNFVDWKP
jgi:glutamine amidotransferase